MTIPLKTQFLYYHLFCHYYYQDIFYFLSLDNVILIILL
jgi:hypothetical protein